MKLTTNATLREKWNAGLQLVDDIDGELLWMGTAQQWSKLVMIKVPVKNLDEYQDPGTMARKNPDKYRKLMGELCFGEADVTRDATDYEPTEEEIDFVDNLRKADKEK
jgi:hypothetical protein